jgi:hypothetical protein
MPLDSPHHVVGPGVREWLGSVAPRLKRLGHQIAVRFGLSVVCRRHFDVSFAVVRGEVGDSIEIQA